MTNPYLPYFNPGTNTFCEMLTVAVEAGTALTIGTTTIDYLGALTLGGGLTLTGKTVTGGTFVSSTLTAPTINAYTMTGTGTVGNGATLTTPILTTPAINGGIFTPNAPVAATGSTVTDAAQLSNGFTVVTASNGTKCVKLPAVPTPGMLVVLFNSVSGQPLIVFPDAAATVNAISSHGALTCANTVPVMLYATSATQWYTLPLLPS